MTKVSVIIPAYNSEKYIVETVNSALDQVNVSVEVIVIDDGSTDKTKEKLANEGLLGKIIYIYQKNEGVSTARNVGLKIASGEYCSFLDSDDLLDEMFCIRLIEKMGKDNCSIAYCNYTYFDEKSAQKVNGKSYDKVQGNIFNRLIYGGNMFPTASILFEKKLVKNLIFDISLKTMEDWWFWIQLFYKNEVTYCEDELCHVRIRTGSLSTNRSQMAQDSVLVFKKIVDNYSKEIRGFSRKEKGQFYYYFANAKLLSGDIIGAINIFWENKMFYGIVKNIIKFFVKIFMVSCKMKLNK